jgi:hypothetical protein
MIPMVRLFGDEVEFECECGFEGEAGGKCKSDNTLGVESKTEDT